MSDVSILFSGGLDSMIMYNYAIACDLDPVCIYVDLGHPYAHKEKAAMARRSRWMPKVEIIELSTLWHLIEKRMSNQIIPSRNVLLAVIGGMFSPEVWLGALDGEQLGKEHDKSPRFFEDTTKLLTFTNEFFQKETRVFAPFAYMSKSETLRWALDNGIPLEELLATSSCYDGEKGKCGVCLTCVKRRLAFLANGIEEPGYDVDLMDSPYMQELIREIPIADANKDYTRFTPKRIEEFKAAMKELGI
jgi:7-cyano-7-deazaguanine synthase